MNSNSPPTSRSRPRRGFTLIEIMVVVVIIVLLIGLALPVFRVITGSRSEAGAGNQIAAALGRARADAIGLDKPIGLATLFNSSTLKSSLAEVEFADSPTWLPNTSYSVGSYVTNPVASQPPYYCCIAFQPGQATFPGTGTYWAQVGGPPLELRQDTDVLPLPLGISVDALCNKTIFGTTLDGNRYLPIGVILFDGKGRLTSLPYGISKHSRLAVAAGLSDDYPDPAATIYSDNVYGVSSQVGLVVFQKDAFINQGFTPAAVAYTVKNVSQHDAYLASSPSQPRADDWLDQNATPLLLNRYTGTLIRAE